MKQLLLNKLFLFEKQSKLFKKKKKVLFIGILIILSFNTLLYILTSNYDITKIQSREHTTGFSHDKGQYFFYFYFYTGNFPLATLNKSLKYSKDDALKEIASNGNDLIMEYKHWSRMGENLRIIAYYPNAIIRCSPENPSMKLFNAIIFILGLILVFSSFVKINKPLLGIILVTIINLTPFFIYEIYQNENILALLASVFIIILGLNLKLIFNKKIKLLKLIIIAIITGLIIGLTSEIRGETIILIVSAILIYLFSRSFNFYLKILTLFLLVSSFYFTKIGIKNYFENNFKETYQLVKENKGHVYDGKRIEQHLFWHPIYCGLGDFDNKYNYEWQDRVAFKYALPILKEKYNLDFKYSGDLCLDDYYDKDSLYYKYLADFSEYEEVIKTKVLSDIKSDPLWYFTIIFKRIINILSNTLPFYILGWFFLILVYFLFKFRQINLLKLLVVSLPLSFTPLFIYSGSNATFNSFFPFLTITIIIGLGFEYFFQIKEKRS